MDDQVIVVGAGIAGLAAATTLGRAGRRVTVLEAAADVGGRARSDVTDGFVRNLGPHALYLAGAGRRVLRGLGIDPPGGAPDIAGMVAFEGALHPGLFTPRQVLGSRLLGWRDRVALGRFLAGPRGSGAVGQTQREWLDSARLTPRARLVVELLARTTSYSDAPELVDAAAVAGQLRLSLRGVRYLDGGWATMVAALRGAAERAGVTVRTGTRVLAVEDAGGGPAVVTEAGTQRAGGVLIAAGGPRGFARLTGTAAPHAVPGALATLDVALRRLPRPSPTLVLGLDAPVYLSVHSAAAALAPAGGAVIHVARYLGMAGADPAGHRAELEGLLDAAQPGWRDELVAARFLPDLAAMSALPLAAEGGLPGRAPVGTGLAGVRVAGDWVGGEGLLADASLASAALAADSLLAEHLDGRREVAGWR